MAEGREPKKKVHSYVLPVFAKMENPYLVVWQQSLWVVLRRRLLVQYWASAVVLGVVLVLPRRVEPVYGVLRGLPRWWGVPLFIVWVPLFIVWVPLLGGVPLCGRGYPSHSSPLVLKGGVYTLGVDPEERGLTKSYRF